MKEEFVMTKKISLIIGANSAIAKALALNIQNSGNTSLIVVSRDTEFYQNSIFSGIKLVQVKNYREEEIFAAVKTILTEKEGSAISQVFICHGLLHNETFQPEKKLEDFNSNAFMEVMRANTLTPMLWLKHLIPALEGKENCKLVIFSARVGSIGDNQLGGWYSYRTSKSALNMLLKTAAIELSRRAKNIKIISFHPGTTDSPLSKPFQRNVPKGKLFTSDFVAEQLLNITKVTPIDGALSYLDWQGKSIIW